MGDRQVSSHKLTEVYAARDEIDATLIQTMLAESYIEARVVGGQIMGAIGEVPAGLPSAPRVWVSDRNADAAIALIREMEERRRETWLRGQESESLNDESAPPTLGKQAATVAGLTAGAVLGVAAVPSGSDGRNSKRLAQVSGDVWKCSTCQEDVTVDFEICWNCQHPRFADDVSGDDSKVGD